MARCGVRSGGHDHDGDKSLASEVLARKDAAYSREGRKRNSLIPRCNKVSVAEVPDRGLL